MAFYGLLALFPAIGALISIWALAFDPRQIEQQIATFSALLPPDAASIVTEQAHNVAADVGGLSVGAVVGILLALYGAAKGMKALIEGLNIIYDEQEERGFVRLNLTPLALMLVVIVAMMVAMGAIIVAPIVFNTIGLGPVVETLLRILRWPLLFGVALVVLAIIYRYGQSRTPARWRWVSWGAAVATAIWTLGSIAFSIYVQNFGSYNETYGSLGAVVILLMWFWLSAFIVLLGAELNSEMEHQTERDSRAAKAAGPTRRLRRRPRRRGALITLAGLALISSTPAPRLAFSAFAGGRPTTPCWRSLRAPASRVTRSGERSRPGATAACRASQARHRCG